MPDKEFTQWLDCGHIFAWRDIQNGRIVSLVVLLIAEIAGREHCVARYDTAHGAAHRDILGIKKDFLKRNGFSSRVEKRFLIMPSVISKPTRKNTSGFSSRTEMGGFSVRVPQHAEKPFTVAACDRILKKHGFHPATPEESRIAREAIARTDAQIARQLAVA